MINLTLFFFILEDILLLFRTSEHPNWFNWFRLTRKQQLLLNKKDKKQKYSTYFIFIAIFILKVEDGNCRKEAPCIFIIIIIFVIHLMYTMLG